MKIVENFKKIIQNIVRVNHLAYQTAGSILIWFYITAFLGGLAPFAFSYLLKVMIDGGSGQYFLPYFRDLNLSLYLTLALVCLILVKWIESTVYQGLHFQYYDYLLRNKMQMGLNTKFLSKVSDLDMEHLENSEIQSLISRVSDTFLWQIPDFVRNWVQIFSALIGLIFSTIALISFNLWLPLIIFILALPRLYFNLKNGNYAWSMYGSGAPEIKKLWYLGSLLRDFDSIQEMRIFQSRESVIQKLDQTQQHLYEINRDPIQKHMRTLIFLPILEFFTVGLLLIQLVGQVGSLELTIGTFAFIFTNTFNLLESVNRSLGYFSTLYSKGLYIEEFFELQSLPKLILEKANPVRFENVEPPLIEFKNVSFGYPGGRQILDNVSFVIQPGETVALVGVNGAGKSTLIKLLCRFYDVSGGQILINGIDLRDYKLSDWYAHVATLFQRFVHYNFTIRENIMLGSPSLVDEEKMLEAARQSGASEFIHKLEKKYDQTLGKQFEDGHELSGGQWQKLAISRAFYENAPILIMDEPTSAIDAEAEKEIFENLLKSYSNKTLLLVSHRFSTVRNANKILVLENGRIIESGSHEELMTSPQKYAKMFLAQAEGYK